MSSAPKPKPRREKRPRRSPSKEQAAAIDYRSPASLRPFLSERGRIKPRSTTGLSRRDQSRLAREVKRSRELGLLPYVTAGAEKEERSRRG